jgi:hypothetical protein
MEIRRRFLEAAIITTFLYAGCSAPGVPQKTSAPAADPAKILSFYPRDSTVTEGGMTVLCYGVSNAKSVRIDPPVEGVSPALTRCVEVRPPKGETRYTLTAVGPDGQSISQSVTIRTGADEAGLPQISSFKVDGKTKDYLGKTVFSVSFGAQNATEISIDPPVFPTLHGAPSGQFSVKPDKTTTYTLSAKGKNGHVAQKKLTIEVGDTK